MLRLASSVALALAIALVASDSVRAADAPELLSVRKIWDEGPHNAFTDLIRFKDRFWCTFRESDGHVGGDGRIRVIVSDDGDAWKSAALIAEEGIDLRDPKFSITPDGRLMIVAGGSTYGGTKVLKGRQPRVLFSKDGITWTAPQKILSEGDWLWRVAWQGDTAWGVSYRTSPKSDADPSVPWLTTLYRSQDGLKWDRVVDFEIPDRPNETTLRFLPDGTLVALVRRELGDKRGWIGSSPSPHTQWKWTPTDQQLGGPNFFVLPDGAMWAASRHYPGGAKTMLGRMTLAGYTPTLTFPSRGDTSYAGLLPHDGLLWVSYYSSHEGKTSIYLAKVRLPGK